MQGAANAYERQALVSEGADTLTDAGLYDESDALLKTELTRSSTPYYFMSGLAANAKARGDKAAALDWYRKAYDAASGPATKLRWGATYFANAVQLAPDDSARIEGIAASVLAQADKTRDAFWREPARADQGRHAVEPVAQQRCARCIGQVDREAVRRHQGNFPPAIRRQAPARA